MYYFQFLSKIGRVGFCTDVMHSVLLLGVHWRAITLPNCYGL